MPDPNQDAFDPIRIARVFGGVPGAVAGVVSSILGGGTGSVAGRRIGSIAGGAPVGTGKSPPSIISIKSRDDYQVKSNVLSAGYTLVQYNVALTMLHENTMRNLQKKIAEKQAAKGMMWQVDLDQDLATLTDRAEPSVTIASTGEKYRNFYTQRFYEPDRTHVPISGDDAVPPNVEVPGTARNTDGWNYYGIESFEMENTISPSGYNPAISQMIMMKMKIKEPHGLKLAEDIRTIADSLGYDRLSTNRLGYRVDIWFSGWTEDGTFEERIPISNDFSGESVNVLSYFVAIINMNAKATGNGTEYELELTPVGHFGYRPEDIVFDGLSIVPKDGAGGAGTFGGFLDGLTVAMESAKISKSSNRIKRKYVFVCPEIVRNASYKPSEDFINKQNLIRDGKNLVSKAKNIDIIKFIEQAWADCEAVQDWFLVDDDGNNTFIRPRVMLTFRFDTKFEPAVNRQLNDYDTITHIYKIEPFITFAKATTAPEMMKDYLKPSSQIARLKKMIQFGMMQRVYEYLNSPVNTEVLNIDLNLKQFYYAALFPTVRSPSSAGVGVQATAGQVQQDTTRLPTPFELQNNSGIKDVDAVLKSIFGAGYSVPKDPDDFSPFRILGDASMNLLPRPDLIPAATTNDNDIKSMKYQYFRIDHLKNDLLVMNLDIKGDPVWLLSPYASLRMDGTDTIEGQETGGTKSTFPLIPGTDRVIFLRIRPPVQEDYMNPGRQYGSSFPLIMGGFYRVIKVISKFEQAKFTQQLQCVKYDHLNYIEDIVNQNSGRLFMVPADGSTATGGNPPSSAVAPGGGVPPGQVPAPPTAPGVPGPTRPAVGGLQAGLGAFPSFPPSTPFAGYRYPNGAAGSGLLYNNPGNIFYGGYDGTVRMQGRWAVYDSPERGVQSIVKDLYAKFNSGNNTVAGIITQYAPPSENDTPGYIRGVSAALGVSPTQRLDKTNRTMIVKFVRSIIQHEVGGTSDPRVMGFFSEEYISRAIGGAIP